MQYSLDGLSSRYEKEKKIVKEFENVLIKITQTEEQSLKN
jgi:hypothetical protein